MCGILRAKRKPFEVWGAEDIGGDPSRLGLDGSFTQVIKTYSPSPRGKGVIIEGEPVDAARTLVEPLLKAGVIPGG